MMATLGGCLLPVVACIGELLILMNVKKLTPGVAISIGALPGVGAVIVGIALQRSRRDLATGLIVGGCLVALVGGSCFMLLSG